MTLPRLVQKADGSYIVKHFYRENTTWQIDADGVRYLNARGIRADDLFPTDIFMQLVMLQLVYTGNRPRTSPTISDPVVAGSADPELKGSAESAFRLLFQQQYAELYKILASDIRGTVSLEDFVSRLTGPDKRRVSSWKIRFVASCPIRDENLPAVDQIGSVVTDFKLTSNARQEEPHLGRRELWTRSNGVWYWWWYDWDQKA